MSKSAFSKIHLISESEVIKKACEINCFTATRYEHRGWRTSDIGEYSLDANLLKSLEKAGFTFEPGRDELRKNCIYLAGHSNQKGSDVFESDCWMWHKEDADRCLTIHFNLCVSEKDRGLLAIPHIWGNCRGGACHQPTINRLVRAIARHFEDSHLLLKKMANDLNYPVILWSDMGLGGLRSVQTLFEELYGKNDLVVSLSKWHRSPFHPSPVSEMGEEKYFVPERIQRFLMDQWIGQLRAFKDSLR